MGILMVLGQYAFSSVFFVYRKCIKLSRRLTTKFWRGVYQWTYAAIGPAMQDLPSTNYGYDPLKKEDGTYSKLDSILMEKIQQNKHKLPEKLRNDVGQLNSVKLYAVVLLQNEIFGKNLENKNILEVGCGRGGGWLTVSMLGHVLSYTGIDLSDEGINCCEALHARAPMNLLQTSPKTKFMVGDSMCIYKCVNFESMDIVLNVESSHCYPCFLTFMKEVYNCLKPGGYFVWADLQFLGDMSTIEWCMNYVGLQIVNETCIVKNVLSSLDMDRVTAIEEQIMAKTSKTQGILNYLLAHIFWNFGSVIPHKRLKEGDHSYYMTICKKIVGKPLAELREKVGHPAPHRLKKLHDICDKSGLPNNA